MQFLIDNASHTYDFPTDFKEDFAFLDLENTISESRWHWSTSEAVQKLYKKLNPQESQLQ